MCTSEEFGVKAVLLQCCSPGCNKHRDGHSPKVFLSYWCWKHGQEKKKKGKCGIWVSAGRESIPACGICEKLESPEGILCKAIYSKEVCLKISGTQEDFKTN